MSSRHMTAADALASAREQLAGAGIDDPALDARSLLRSVLGVSQAELLKEPGRTLAPGEATAFEQAVARRSGREPLQYITGHVEFYGRTFRVDERVLIPRPETELLVEQALAFVKERGVANPRVLDIGTGSGVLALSMAAELPNARVVATDVSEDALAVARENAALLRVADRLEFINCSLTEDVAGVFDIVLCNPPYVLSSFLDGPDVQPELAFEPRLALDGGPEGMAIYTRLLSELPRVMTDGAAAYIEIDPPVAARCLKQAKSAFPSAAASVLTDLAGLERCLVIELPT